MAKDASTNKSKFLMMLKKEKISKIVIDAFSEVRQEGFFDKLFKPGFYTTEVIPIGFGETSDPPLALAKMLKYLSLNKKQRVLEVGTGSGYSTALLSTMVNQVVTVEYNEELARNAKSKLASTGITNIKFFAGDGTELNRDLGMFDAIIIHAACKKRPLSLLANLKNGGKMVFPMGPEHKQQIVLLINEPGVTEDELFKTSFHELCEFSLINGKYGNLIY